MNALRLYFLQLLLSFSSCVELFADVFSFSSVT